MRTFILGAVLFAAACAATPTPPAEPAPAPQPAPPPEPAPEPIPPADAVVTWRFETESVGGDGDAADDPAFFQIAPNGAGVDGGDKSVILGTDKTAGLYVFDMEGRIRQFLEVGRLNNVDTARDFMFAGQPHGLAVASDRTNGALAVFLIDPYSGEVSQPPRGASIPLDLEDEPYGLCMGVIDDAFYVFVNDKTGQFVQLRIFESGSNGSGRVNAVEVRRFAVESQPEGCVVDEDVGAIYVGIEERGIARFSAHHDATPVGVLVAGVDGERLVADVEGLAIKRTSSGEKWLVASSQGDSAFAVFELPGMDYVGRFRIDSGGRAAFDAVTETDGIDVTADGVGGRDGLLIVQDDQNDTGGQNFKVVQWELIAMAFDLPWSGDPRSAEAEQS